MSHWTGNSGSNSGGNVSTPGSGERVIDFSEIRAQRLEEKRRKTERIFFQELLGVYCVTGNDQMRQIRLIEVSEDGCSFQVPFNSSNPWPSTNDKMPIRLYFSQDTYLEIYIKIENSKGSIDQGERYVRYGCSVDKTTSSYPAYQQFVKFLKAYSEQSHKDMGNVSVFYL